MKSTSKIIALDLKNACVENLNFWFLTTDYITCNKTKDYLRNRVKERENVDDPLEMVFIFNNLSFGYIKRNSLPSLEMFEPLIEELLQINPITLDQIEPYRSVIIDWIFNAHIAKPRTAFELSDFQTHKNEKNIMFPNFTFYVTAIDVEELGFYLKEFYTAVNDKFRTILKEFRAFYGKGNYLNTVKLKRIFILERYILGYTFQLEGEPYEHFFWNMYLGEQLFLMDKITFDNATPISIDTILDNISSNGMECLTLEEQDYLIKLQ